MPRLTIPKAVLHPALAEAARVVERRNTIPALAMVRLALAGGTLTLTATDLDLEVTVRRENTLEVEGEGSTLLPAHTLAEIAGKFGEDAEISLAWEPGEARASIRAGRSRFTLGMLPPEDFPDRAAQDLPHSFTLQAAQLAATLARVSFAVSTEETRYYLNGVYMHPDSDDFLAFVATDGHRLARQHLVMPGVEGAPGVIIPRKTVSEVEKLAKAHKGEITVAWSQHQIRFDFGKTVLTSKLIDGTFPDYARVIPLRNEKHATLGINELVSALARVSALAGERGRAVKFSFNKDSATLSSANPDLGEAEEEITAQYTAAPLDIGFNAKYLGDALAALGGDKVRLALDHPGASALLTTPEDEQFLTVLMPMRV